MDRRRPLLLVRALTLGALLASIVGVGTAAAADRSAPSAPANVRVTATTPYSITLAWAAPKANDGVTSYVICCANVNSQTFPGPATGAVYTAGVEPGRSHTLLVYARDAAGNWSRASSAVTVTTPRDTTAPATPTVTVTDVGPTHVSLAWSSVDDSPKLWFTVTQNGSPMLTADKRTSATFGLLQPETTYSFTVVARDFGGNSSPPSAPVTVTTEARDTTDTAPPTTPGNLRTTLAMPDGETWLFWDQSTDNATPQPIIEYRIFVNGVYDSSVVGFGRQILYGAPLSFNTYSVIAVDASGNQSDPATLVVDNR